METTDKTYTVFKEDVGISNKESFSSRKKDSYEKINTLKSYYV